MLNYKLPHDFALDDLGGVSSAGAGAGAADMFGGNAGGMAATRGDLGAAVEFAPKKQYREKRFVWQLKQASALWVMLLAM